MNEQESGLTVSKAIIYGAVIVALVIGGSFVYQKRFIEKNMPNLVKKAIEDLTPNPDKMKAVSKDDHILGDLKAPVKLVIYTDLECPYCKVFHKTINELKDNYIKDGKLAIVYRNLPLDQLHQKARPEAIATECVAKLGGNDKYWAYVDKIMEKTSSNDGLDLNLLPTFATELGLDAKAFANCQKDEDIAQKIIDQETDGQKAGAEGTPYPIVTYKEEVKGALGGALPANQIKEIVDQLIAEKE